MFWLFILFSQGQTKTSNGSGNWNTATIWTPTGVPTATDDVVISDGTTVSLNANASCNKLTVGSGVSAAVLQFSGNTTLTVSIGGDITINSLSSFSILTNSNRTHSITLSGNIINNGTLDMQADANSLCNITFVKNGNQSISGNGTLTRLNRITLNMGSSLNNVLDVSSSTFTANSNFLILSNGLFKLSVPSAATLVPFTASTSIGATAGLWLNTSSAVLSCSAGVGIAGLLQVSSGTLYVGNANNEDLVPSGGGTVNISGGSVIVAGKYNGSVSASTFSLSGGSIKISNNASTNTSIAPFHISASGSVFSMTGGTLVMRREGGTGGQDLGFVNTGSSSGAVTGGTIQFGDATSPANQNIRINSTYPVPNIVVSSASVNAILNTNSLSVVNNITISSGTLSSNNLNFSLGGNWLSTGTFSPGTGTVIFNSSSSQSITKSGGETFNALLFSGSGTKTFASPVTANSNFSIASGSSVDLSASNYSLNLKGHFVNDGTFNARNGLVSLSGTTTQSITGTSSTTFYNLTLSNTNGATLGNAENLEGTLSLTNGTFSTNAKVFTIISNALTTGRVGQITGTGDLVGNVTVQRFIPGGSTGWSFIGSPLSSALTLNDWDDNLFISCPSCPDGYVSGFSSIYSYDETQPGVYDAAASYVSLSSISDPINSGKGYWVYTGTGLGTTNDITLDVTGSIRKFNYTIPLSYSNYGSATNDGWNLITNPYPSAISWAGLKGTTANIDNAIYVYNADLNSGSGGYASYVNGVSSPAVGSGGIGDNIPMCQGFYVHSTGATSLSAQESNKVNNNPVFLRSASTSTQQGLLRLNLLGPNNSIDESVLYLENGATKNFDDAYDSYKLGSNNPLAPVIAINYNNFDFQINAVSPINGSFTIPLKTTTGVSGNYTIGINNLSSFPSGACIVLLDKANANSINLKASDYVFYLSDTTAAPRFELQITLNHLSVNAQIQQPDCISPDKGFVTVKGTNNGPWNYVWKNNDVLVQTNLNMASADTLKNLSEGAINVEITTIGQCDYNQLQFTIYPQTPVTANFWGIDTLWLGNASSTQFFNQSLNAQGLFWLSGNSNNTSSNENPVFTYTEPGEYNITLIVTSASGCVDSITKKLMVMDGLVGLRQLTASPLRLKTLADNCYVLEGDIIQEKVTNAFIYDLYGNLIKEVGSEFSGPEFFTINLQSLSKGVYHARVFCADGPHVLKLMVK